MPRPQAVPSTRTTLGNAARTPACGDDSFRRPGHVRRRAAERRERVIAREGIEDRPRRRQRLIEVTKDHRVLEVTAQTRRGHRGQGDRADDPDDAQPDAGGEHRTEQPVDGPQTGKAQGKANAHSEPLEEAREQSSDDERSRQAEERGVDRVRPAREDQRSDPRSDDRTEGESTERQAADDQALDVSPDREQDRDGDDQPIHPVHVEQCTRAKTPAGGDRRAGCRNPSPSTLLT